MDSENASPLPAENPVAKFRREQAEKWKRELEEAEAAERQRLESLNQKRAKRPAAPKIDPTIQVSEFVDKKQAEWENVHEKRQEVIRKRLALEDEKRKKQHEEAQRAILRLKEREDEIYGRAAALSPAEIKSEARKSLNRELSMLEKNYVKTFLVRFVALIWLMLTIIDTAWLFRYRHPIKPASATDASSGPDASLVSLSTAVSKAIGNPNFWTQRLQLIIAQIFLLLGTFLPTTANANPDGTSSAGFRVALGLSSLRIFPLLVVDLFVRHFLTARQPLTFFATCLRGLTVPASALFQPDLFHIADRIPGVLIKAMDSYNAHVLSWSSPGATPQFLNALPASWFQIGIPGPAILAWWFTNVWSVVFLVGIAYSAVRISIFWLLRSITVRSALVSLTSVSDVNPERRWRIFSTRSIVVVLFLRLLVAIHSVFADLFVHWRKLEPADFTPATANPVDPNAAGDASSASSAGSGLLGFSESLSGIRASPVFGVPVKGMLWISSIAATWDLTQWLILLLSISLLVAVFSSFRWVFLRPLKSPIHLGRAADGLGRSIRIGVIGIFIVSVVLIAQRASIASITAANAARTNGAGYIGHDGRIVTDPGAAVVEVCGQCKTGELHAGDMRRCFTELDAPGTAQDLRAAGAAQSIGVDFWGLYATLWAIGQIWILLFSIAQMDLDDAGKLIPIKSL